MRCIILSFIFYFVILQSIFTNNMFAQTGRWLEYSLDGMGYGTALYGCGNMCAGYTLSYSQYILIFDAANGGWLRIDMNSMQAFNRLLAKGDVIFIWGDQLIFAYSAGLAQWDTLHYEGNPLDSGGLNSFGCSAKIAFFITDQKFYVFDSDVGKWQIYDYGLPPNFHNANYTAQDDYVVLTLSSLNGFYQYKNVVYSRYTKSFNKLEKGCSVSKDRYHFGFAGFYEEGNRTDYTLIGYSALDNQFDVLSYTLGESETKVDPFEQQINADSIISYCIAFRKVVKPYELVRVRYYGYSTLLGTWHTAVYDIDIQAERYGGNINNAALYSVDNSVLNDMEFYRFYFYLPLNGSFAVVTTDLISKSNFSSTQVGGNVFCAIDEVKAWGYDPANGSGKHISLVYNKTSNLHSGENYVTFVRWSEDSDIMRMYFYNKNTNNWSSIDLAEKWNVDGNAAAHIYLYHSEPDNQTVIYSAYLDRIIKVSFSEGNYVLSRVNEILAFASSDEKSYLINAMKGSVYEKNFKFYETGLGLNTAVFFNMTERTLHGYSALSDRWTELAVSEDPYSLYNKNNIGLVSVMINNNGYAKYYVFNGYSESWVALEPQGKYVSQAIGDGTALVIRTTHIYAFDPQVETTLSEAPATIDRNHIRLHQNYPNPFNPTTTIEYELPKPTKVELKIYDLLGQEIITLLDEHQTAGIKSVVWDGRDQFKRPVSSGVYLYMLKAGKQIQNRKMILMR